MQRSPQGKSTKEFREEAVKMVTIEKISLPEAARRLSLPSSTLGNWLKASKTGKLGEIGKNYRPLTEVELELARTRKELVEVKMERDILKKAAAYFAREASPQYFLRGFIRCVFNKFGEKISIELGRKFCLGY
jgi:transposase-like protein